MKNRIAVVDLFAGPGGLAEGFSAVETSEGFRPFKVALSIEKESAAHSTLLLRTFLRQFESGFPDEYYSALNNRDEEPCWAELYLPDFSLDTAGAELRQANIPRSMLVGVMGEVSTADGTSGFVRDNAGGLLVRLLEASDEPVAVNDLTFRKDSLRGRLLKGIAFNRCYFHATSLDNTSVVQCVFTDCEFERIEFDQPPNVANSSFQGDSRVHSLSASHGSDASDVYEPRRIVATLLKLGFTMATASLIPTEAPGVEEAGDPRLKLAEKALQTFQRTTQVSEGTFRLRLSVNAHQFFQDVHPQLLRVGVLRIDNASQKLRLGIPMSRLAKAIADAQGDFEQFLRLASSK